MSVEVYGLCVGRADCFDCELFPDAYNGKLLPSGEENNLIELAPGKKMTYLLCAYVVRTASRIILIDTGCNDLALASEYGIYQHKSVVSLLQEIGIAAQDVDDVVITHGHWINVGDLEQFSEARAWICQAELSAMQESVNSSDSRKKNYRETDYLTIKNWPKLEVINRCRAISECVRADMVAGHTPGCMAVTVLVNGASCLTFASDNAWFFDNLEGRQLTPALHSGGHNALRRLKFLARQAAVIPSRDLLVWQRFQNVAPGVIRMYPR